MAHGVILETRGQVCSLVAAAAGHPLVPKHQEQGVTGQLDHSVLDHGAHLTQLPAHLRMMMPVLVASVIYT